MAGDAYSVIAAAGARLGEVTNENDCAKFVSEVFRDSGNGLVFPYSTWVPSIVGSFRGTAISTDPQTAMAGDLIVFGTNEHIMIYEGSGMVIGTGTGKSGVTSVVSVSIGAVTTDKGLGFSKVLHTGLTQMSGTELVKSPGTYGPTLNPLDAFGPGGINVDPLAAFGTIFAWVPSFVANGAVLLLIVVLAVGGIRQVVDSQD
jgi:hypothetical protein